MPLPMEYIKISEKEIADDYPMPKQYEMLQEEIDELIVLGGPKDA